MKGLLATLILVQCFMQASSSGDATWNYKAGDANGPENWPNSYSSCGGRNQSPININSSDVSTESGEGLAFLQKKERIFKLKNNGKFASLQLTGEDRNKEGVMLREIFLSWESEHQIDKKFALELGMYYGNQTIENDADWNNIGRGKTVVVLVKEAETSNDEIKKIAEAVENIANAGSEFTMNTGIDLDKLLPNNKSYYKYQGSVPVPPCSEVLDYYVFKEPITITKEQLEKFRKLKDGEGNLMSVNHRPIQPKNERTITLVNVV